MNQSELTHQDFAALTNASLGKRLAALVYDGFLIVAIWMISSLALLAVTDSEGHLQGAAYQAFLYAELLIFFVYFWSFKGQTLGMQVWRIMAVQESGRALTPTQATVRFLIATPSIACFGLGLLWLLVSPEKTALHDLLSRSRVVQLPKR
jgi:uncharacterized RDD family membrane protein YckC